MSHDELCGLINSIMTLTNVAFFGLAGASLKLVSTFTRGGGCKGCWLGKLYPLRWLGNQD